MRMMMRKRVNETPEIDIAALVAAQIKEALKPPPYHPCKYCRRLTVEGDSFCERCIKSGIHRASEEEYEEYCATLKWSGRPYFAHIGLVSRVPDWESLTPREIHSALEASYGNSLPRPLYPAEYAEVLQQQEEERRMKEQASKELAREQRIFAAREELAKSLTHRVGF